MRWFGMQEYRPLSGYRGRLMPQLVGTTCAVCRGRIASIVVGEFCRFCGRPLHTACFPKTTPPWFNATCPTCGVALPSTSEIQANRQDDRREEKLRSWRRFRPLIAFGGLLVIAQGFFALAVDGNVIRGVVELVAGIWGLMIVGYDYFIREPIAIDRRMRRG